MNNCIGKIKILRAVDCTDGETLYKVIMDEGGYTTYHDFYSIRSYDVGDVVLARYYPSHKGWQWSYFVDAFFEVEVINWVRDGF